MNQYSQEKQENPGDRQFEGNRRSGRGRRPQGGLRSISCAAAAAAQGTGPPFFFIFTISVVARSSLLLFRIHLYTFNRERELLSASQILYRVDRVIFSGRAFLSCIPKTEGEVCNGISLSVSAMQKERRCRHMYSSKNCIELYILSPFKKM